MEGCLGIATSRLQIDVHLCAGLGAGRRLRPVCPSRVRFRSRIAFGYDGHHSISYRHGSAKHDLS